jgi:hypothetical protein
MKRNTRFAASAKATLWVKTLLLSSLDTAAPHRLIL